MLFNWCLHLLASCRRLPKGHKLSLHFHLSCRKQNHQFSDFRGHFQPCYSTTIICFIYLFIYAFNYLWAVQLRYSWIHAFSKDISAMRNAISFVQDLNSCHRVHLLQRKPLHHWAPLVTHVVSVGINKVRYYSLYIYFDPSVKHRVFLAILKSFDTTKQFVCGWQYIYIYIYIYIYDSIYIYIYIYIYMTVYIYIYIYIYQTKNRTV